jgi:hypothetical protein
MQSTLDDETLNAALADVGFGVGVAATVGLLLTFALADEESNPTSREPAQTSTRPFITPDSAGVSWELRF